MISVAIGLGLAVLYYAGSLWFGALVAKRSAALAPALMVAGFMLRLTVLAAVVVPLAIYTELNLIALLVAFLVVFTIFSVWRVYALAKNTDGQTKSSTAVNVEEAAPARKKNSSKGA